jgi:predicted ATP-grasp superfamily ATP-dependent carboligase
LIPVGELEIRLLATKFTEISSKIELLMCDPDVVAVCLDKPTMSAVVDQLGVPQSRHATASDCKSLISAADSIGYPCVVKLADSEFLLHGKKALIYEDSESIRKDFDNWPIENKSLIVQTYIAAERMNLYFFACEGRIVSLGQVIALRTDRLDGTGLAVSGRTVSPDVVLVEYCQSIVEHLHYTGVGCMQFLVDDVNGVTTFLEHNPRLGAGCMLPYFAGLDLPRLMLDFALNGQSSPEEPAYPCKTGVQYAWMTGDIMGLKRAVSSREIGVGGAAFWLLRMMKTTLTCPHHVSWDWRDPLPTIVQAGRLLVSALKVLKPGRTKQ